MENTQSTLVSPPQAGARRQPTVREINARLWCGQGYCYVSLADGRRMRVSWVKSRKGVMEGRVINTSGWTTAPTTWEVIPADAVVELS